MTTAFVKFKTLGVHWRDPCRDDVTVKGFWRPWTGAGLPLISRPNIRLALATVASTWSAKVSLASIVVPRSRTYTRASVELVTVQRIPIKMRR